MWRHRRQRTVGQSRWIGLSWWLVEAPMVREEERQRWNVQWADTTQVKATVISYRNSSEDHKLSEEGGRHEHGSKMMGAAIEGGKQVCRLINRTLHVEEWRRTKAGLEKECYKREIIWKRIYLEKAEDDHWPISWMTSEGTLKGIAIRKQWVINFNWDNWA